MKKFIIKIALFFFIIYSFDKLLLIVRAELPKNINDKRLEQVLNEKINADILVIGSSRSSAAIIAGNISDSLQLKAYNLSFLGTDIEFHEFLLKCYLKSHRKKPQVIVLAVDEISELVHRESIQFRYDLVYPLVQYNLVRDLLYQRGDLNKIAGSLFVRHQLKYTILNWDDPNFYANAPKLACGSSPLEGFKNDFNKSFFDHAEFHDTLNELPSKIIALERFIKICNKEKIKLILAPIPNYWEPSPSFNDRIKQIVKNQAIVMNYDLQNQAYKNPENYFNAAHMNVSGARVYTAELINFIRLNKK